MFSDHLRPLGKPQGRNVLLIAGVFVIVGQIAAMALVADSQVKKAQLRDSRNMAQSLVIAECLAISTGLNRHGCFNPTSSELVGAIDSAFEVALTSR